MLFRSLVIFLLASIPLEGFYPPTKAQVELDGLENIKYNLKAKGTGLTYRELFDKAIPQEECGFFGYHGDSLDFLVYQDIIRVALEELTGISIRKDFHFLAPPLSDETSPKSLEELSLLFTREGYSARKVQEATFPLNFSLYSNHNRSGWNSLKRFSSPQNTVREHLIKKLSLFFETAGLSPDLPETLFALSSEYLDRKAGVLLQFFDGSANPYAFADQFSFAARPNGFIAENRKIHEYFLMDNGGSFPQEVRLLLTTSLALNPHAPLIIKRYTKNQPGKLKLWEQELRKRLQASAVDQEKLSVFKENLEAAWREKSHVQ